MMSNTARLFGRARSHILTSRAGRSRCGIAIGAFLISLRLASSLYGQARPPGSDHATPGATSLPAVFETMRLGLDRVKHIKYDATMTFQRHVDAAAKPPGPAEKPFRLSYRLSYMASDDLFKSRVAFNTIDGKDSDITVAYNGQKYQRFKKEIGLLEETARPRADQPVQSLAIQPIAFPFLFAFDDADQFDYVTLLSEETWDRLLAHSELGAEQVVDGKTCPTVVIDRKRNGKDNHIVVTLDRSRGFYPIRVVSESDVGEGLTIRSQLDVTTQQIETPTGPVVMPMKIRTREEKPDGTLVLSQTYEILPETLVINEPVDKKEFSIDTAGAWNGVIDQDRNILTAPRTAPRRTPWVLLTLNLAALLALASFLFWRRHRRNAGKHDAPSLNT